VASTAELKEFLQHHISYELMMLRYTHARMHDTRHQLQWNAYMESFAVHARNFEYFLDNIKEGDSRNYVANDYVFPDFTPSRKPIQIHQKISTYVVHLGTARSGEAEKKFNRERADKALKWIEDNFTRFLASLPDKSWWEDRFADPSLYKPPQIQPAPSVSNHPISLSTNISSSTHGVLLGVVMPAVRSGDPD
jgi:hypothetical protein